MIVFILLGILFCLFLGVAIAIPAAIVSAAREQKRRDAAKAQAAQ